MVVPLLMESLLYKPKEMVIFRIEAEKHSITNAIKTMLSKLLVFREILSFIIRATFMFLNIRAKKSLKKEPILDKPFIGIQ